MLKPIRRDDIPVTTMRRGKVVKEIMKFLQTDDAVAEVVVDPGENAKVKYNSYFQASKRLGRPVIVTVRRDRLFLIKKEEADA